MDYFAIIKKFWDDAPYTDGFKSDYAALFFAILDAVNRNLWNETEIEYDRIINKTKLGKRMYLSGREWLHENSFITYQRGMNDYARAKFNIAVQFRTASVPTTDTSAAPQLHLSCPPTVPYLNKTIDYNTNKQDIYEPTEISPKTKADKKTFVVPTESEVSAYFKEKNSSSQKASDEFAELFTSFYQSKGWMIGSNKMKDWKAAVNGKWKNSGIELMEKYPNRNGSHTAITPERKLII